MFAAVNNENSVMMLQSLPESFVTVNIPFRQQRTALSNKVRLKRSYNFSFKLYFSSIAFSSWMYSFENVELLRSRPTWAQGFRERFTNGGDAGGAGGADMYGFLFVEK